MKTILITLTALFISLVANASVSFGPYTNELSSVSITVPADSVLAKNLVDAFDKSPLTVDEGGSGRGLYVDSFTAGLSRKFDLERIVLRESKRSVTLLLVLMNTEEKLSVGMRSLSGSDQVSFSGDIARDLFNFLLSAEDSSGVEFESRIDPTVYIFGNNAQRVNPETYGSCKERGRERYSCTFLINR